MSAKTFTHKSFPPFATNCYAVEGGIILDPGMGSAEWINELAQSQGFHPTMIILTHGHLDHCFDAKLISDQWKIPVYVSKADAYLIEDPLQGIRPESVLAFHEIPAIPLSDFDRLDFMPTRGNFAGFEIFHAPGHTRGCVLLVNESDVFSGDVLFNGTIGRTDLPCSNPEDMVASLRKLLRGTGFDLSDELQLRPGHGESSTIRHERMTNPFLLKPESILL
ncbi:MAG: MBL fold metallo-hydrolase [Corynebacterium sp.]|nr:MBL fold metallo-hydrolase [Corynebacterium sp.]